MVYLHAKFEIPSSNHSLVITTKGKLNTNFLQVSKISLKELAYF
jgi:hypothetical protein